MYVEHFDGVLHDIFEVDYPLGPSIPIPAESYPRYSNRLSPCIKSPFMVPIWNRHSVDGKFLYLDEQVDDLSPGPRGQVVEVGKDSTHDETSYLEEKKKRVT